MTHSIHHPGHDRLRLPRWARLFVYVAGSCCAITGGAWLVLHHFLQREGAFGVEANPLEHPALVAHGVLGLAMLWVLGLVWLPHVRRGWAKRRNRRMGGVMAGLMLWLGGSAAGLYYLGDERWRGVASVGHWVLGLVAVAWLPLHVWHGRRHLRSR